MLEAGNFRLYCFQTLTGWFYIKEQGESEGGGNSQVA